MYVCVQVYLCTRVTANTGNQRPLSKTIISPVQLCTHATSSQNFGSSGAVRDHIDSQQDRRPKLLDIGAVGRVLVLVRVLGTKGGSEASSCN